MCIIGHRVEAEAVKTSLEALWEGQIVGQRAALGQKEDKTTMRLWKKTPNKQKWHKDAVHVCANTVAR